MTIIIPNYAYNSGSADIKVSWDKGGNWVAPDVRVQIKQDGVIVKTETFKGKKTGSATYNLAMPASPAPISQIDVDVDIVNFPDSGKIEAVSRNITLTSRTGQKNTIPDPGTSSGEFNESDQPSIIPYVAAGAVCVGAIALFARGKPHA